MTAWKKIEYSGKGKKPPYWLEERIGTFKTSYRIRYRANKCLIQKTLKGTFEKWEDAFRVGEKLIASTRFGEREKPKSFITCAELCDEIVELKKSLAKGTYLQAEIYYRVHLKPFLEKECPYAANLNHSVWLKYKNKFRIKNPTKPLFGHWKFFSQLFIMAHEKGLIKEKIKIEYNEEKDDNKHLQAFIKHANEVWRKRVIVQRLTGQRPGIIRELKKSYVNKETGLVKIPKSISKNRKGYEFIIPKVGMKELNDLWDNGSDYFFPSRIDKKQPMDRCLNGWHETWERAEIDEGYTPHDLRHTFLTEKVKEPKINLPTLCFSCDLSYDVLSKTYLHLTGEDTDQIAQSSNANAKKIFGEAL
jgi:integrase